MLPESIITTARLLNEDRERLYLYALLLAEIERTAVPVPPVRVRIGTRLVGIGERLAGSCAYPPQTWRTARPSQ